MLADESHSGAALGIQLGQSGANAANRTGQVTQLPQCARPIHLGAADQVHVAVGGELPRGAVEELDRLLETPLGVTQDGLEIPDLARLAAVAGAALMVLTRCIAMDEAYRSIEWRSIFLIAGMLPLGTAS